MEGQVKPDSRFIEDFNLVMNHYKVTIDEARYEKKRVMANFTEAAKCYSVIAARIRGFND